MAHWQLGGKDKARQWYDKAVESMEENKPEDEELRRFRAEAEALIGQSEEHHGDTESTEKTRDERSGARDQGKRNPAEPHRHLPNP